MAIFILYVTHKMQIRYSIYLNPTEYLLTVIEIRYVVRGDSKLVL